MKWAADQDDDALYMWGMRDAGGSSSEVAVLRLALSCFGEGKPDIVGFGSSVGFNDAYCKAHPKKEICANWVAQEMGRR